MTDGEIVGCPKCELPIDPVINNAELHAANCIGISPFVLHNRQAGMVVYLSTEEWDAMQNANTQDVEVPSEMIKAIAGRALYGITEV